MKSSTKAMLVIFSVFLFISLLLAAAYMDATATTTYTTLCDVYEQQDKVEMRVVSTSAGAVVEVNLNGYWVHKDRVHISCMERDLQ